MEINISRCINCHGLNFNHIVYNKSDCRLYLTKIIITEMNTGFKKIILKISSSKYNEIVFEGSKLIWPCHNHKSIIVIIIKTITYVCVYIYIHTHSAWPFSAFFFARCCLVPFALKPFALFRFLPLWLLSSFMLHEKVDWKGTIYKKIWKPR